MADEFFQSDVRGLAELTDSMTKFGLALRDEAGKIAARTADSVASIARVQVPYDTGALRASVTTRSGKVLFGKSVKTRMEMGGRQIPYAGWIEFGGARPHEREFIPGGRYFTPPAVQSEPRYLDEQTRTTERVIGGFPWIPPPPQRI